MYKALFIPNSSNQLNKFLAIARNFSGDFSYLVLNLDRFKNSMTLASLKECGIPHILLQDMSDRGAEALLKDVSPDIIVVGNDTEALSYLFVNVGRRLGMPSLLVQDGTLTWRTSGLPMDMSSFLAMLSVHSPSFLFSRLVAKLKNVPRARMHQYGHFAGHVSVWGDFTKKCLMEHGVKKEKIVVTGSPSMDELIRYKADRAATLRGIGANPKLNTIFYAASDMTGARLWSKKEFDDAISSVCNAAKGLGAQLIIRQHPFHLSREPDYLRKFVDGKSVFSGNKADLLAVIAASDVLVTEASSCAAEGVALGKPLAVINLVGRPYIAEPFPGIYISSGVALPIDRHNSADSVLAGILFGKTSFAMKRKRQEFIAAHFHRLDGLSGKRIVELMAELASKRRA